MKVALITDTHAGARNDSVVFNEFFLNFFETNFFPYLIENNIKTIIHLGDVFDRRKFLNFQILNSWRSRVFDWLEQNDITMHIIVGNHDTYFKNTNDINSVREILGKYSNIIIYSEAETVNIGGCDMLFVPWVNPENEANVVEQFKNTKADIVMGHLEIQGFEMHRGHVNDDRGFTKDFFRKMDIVYSGHFHCRSSSDGITYLGSPYEMVWSDADDVRGFHIFDTETRKLDLIENKDRIFHKIYYNDLGLTPEQILDVDFSIYKERYVKIIVEHKENHLGFESFFEAIQNSNPCDIKVIENIIDGESSIDEDVVQTKDTLTLLTDYVDGMEVENKKSLVSLVRELYLEAANMDRE